MHEFTLLSKNFNTISIIDLKKFENMLLLLMPKFQHIQPKNYQSFFFGTVEASGEVFRQF